MLSLPIKFLLCLKLLEDLRLMLGTGVTGSILDFVSLIGDFVGNLRDPIGLLFSFSLMVGKLGCFHSFPGLQKGLSCLLLLSFLLDSLCNGSVS